MARRGPSSAKSPCQPDRGDCRPGCYAGRSPFPGGPARARRTRWIPAGRLPGAAASTVELAQVEVVEAFAGKEFQEHGSDRLAIELRLDFLHRLAGLLFTAHHLAEETVFLDPQIDPVLAAADVRMGAVVRRRVGHSTRRPFFKPLAQVARGTSRCSRDCSAGACLPPAAAPGCGFGSTKFLPSIRPAETRISGSNCEP